MINSNIVFVTKRGKKKSNQSPWRIISKRVQSVTLRTLASKYNGQRRRTSVSQARLCWLQRQLYDSGRGRVRWLISQADIFVFPPKGDISTVDGKFHFIWTQKFCQVLGTSFSRVAGKKPDAQPENGFIVRERETHFEEVGGLTLPRCRCKMKSISSSSSCLKPEHGSRATTRSATAGELVGIPAFPSPAVVIPLTV